MELPTSVRLSRISNHAGFELSGGNVAESANQHYVPQFYFRGFSSDDRSVCVLNRSTGKTIPVASIKGQASKKYFYGDAAVEKRLQQVDGAFSGVVRRFRECAAFDEFSGEDYYTLLQNIMLQKSRTMSARTRSKAMQDHLLQLHLEIGVHTDESLDDETRQAFLNFAREAEADPRQYQTLEMSIALDRVDSLLDLRPVVLENRTNRPFIFGDAPVVFSNPHLRKVRLRGVLGAQTPGLMIFYPLSPFRQLVFVDEDVYRLKRQTSDFLRVRDLRDVSTLNRLQIQNASSAVYFHTSDFLRVRDLRDVSTLNRLQIQNASSAVYFHDYKFAQYVASLWQEERARLADHRGAVVEAPGFDRSGKSMGNIFHSFDRQLPLIPRLSFVQYVEVPEREYRFSRRKER